MFDYDDVEYYGSMFLVGLVVVGLPALLLFINYKYIMGQ